MASGWSEMGAPASYAVPVRAWRRVGGVPQVLYTFAGASTRQRCTAVMQQVRRLNNAAPGVGESSLFRGMDGPLRQQAAAALRELQGTATGRA